MAIDSVPLALSDHKDDYRRINGHGDVDNCTWFGFTDAEGKKWRVPVCSPHSGPGDAGDFFKMFGNMFYGQFCSDHDAGEYCWRQIADGATYALKYGNNLSPSAKARLQEIIRIAEEHKSDRSGNGVQIKRTVGQSYNDTNSKQNGIERALTTALGQMKKDGLTYLAGSNGEDGPEGGTAARIGEKSGHPRQDPPPAPSSTAGSEMHHSTKR